VLFDFVNRKEKKNISAQRVQEGFNYQLSRHYCDWLRLHAIVPGGVLIGQKTTIFSMRMQIS